MKHDEIKDLVNRGILQENPDMGLVQKEIKSLVDRGFIRELPNNFFEFDNNLTWEVVYETLAYAERRRIHNLVARHIEKRNEGQLGGVSDVLAYHYERSGNIKKSIWYFSLAGDRAAEMYANEDSISSYKQVLDLLGQYGEMLASDKGLVLEKIADVYRIRGQFKESADYYIRVLELTRSNKSKRKSKLLPWMFRDSTRESELCRKIAIAVEGQSEYEKSVGWLDEAIRKLPMRPGGVASRIAAMKSGVLYRMGKYKDGIQWGKKALKHAARLKLDADVASAQNILGLIYLAEGKMELAENYFSKAADLFERLDDYPSIANTKSNLAICYMWTGELSSAINNYFMALEADKRVQNISSMAIDHTNLAEVLIMAGDVEEAETHIKFVHEAFEDKLCPPDLAGLAFVHLCRCEMINGDLSKSQIAIDEGLELIRNAGQSMILGQAELQLAELLYAQEEFSQAENTCLDALTVIEVSGMKPLEVIGKRIMAEVNNKRGRLSETIAIINDSINLARETGRNDDADVNIVAKV